MRERRAVIDSFVRARARLAVACLSIAVAWAAACLDGTGPRGPTENGLLVSDTAARMSPAAADAVGSPGVMSETDVVYVSLPPGTTPEGTLTTISNPSNGATVTAPVTAGGFDPIAISAAVGNAIEIVVRNNANAVVLKAQLVVTARRRPTVVRTDPPPKKRDVPLNSVILIVFSEPIDRSTVTETSVRLSTGGTQTAGQLEFDDPDGLTATFVPARPLRAATSYRLELTQAIRDLDGEALNAPLTAEFVTETMPPGRIAFVRANESTEAGGIMVMNSDGSGATALTGNAQGAQNAHPAWSPDISRIAFASDRDAFGWDIYVMNADGSGTVRVTNLPMNPHDPTWSPDGRKIAFVSDHEYACSASGFCYVPHWLYTIDSDGTSLTRLWSEPVTDSVLVFHWDPAWSPDGSRIAFTRHVARQIASGDVVDETTQVYVINADGSGATSLAAGWSPAWSPDGTQLAFVRWPDGQFCSGGEIYIMNAAGSGIQQVTSGADVRPWSGLAWSPNGTKIAFSSGRDGSHNCSFGGEDIYLTNTDGSGMTRLTFTGLDHSPAWSPRE